MNFSSFLHLVVQVGAEASVAAEPLVGAVLAALDDVSCDHTASILEGSLPAELH